MPFFKNTIFKIFKIVFKDFKNEIFMKKEVYNSFQVFKLF